MRKMRLFLAAATFCSAMAVGYSAYTNATMTEQERLIQANIEALSSDGEGQDYNNAKKVYCDTPAGAIGCKGQLFRNCDNGIFCTE